MKKNLRSGQAGQRLYLIAVLFVLLTLLAELLAIAIGRSFFQASSISVPVAWTIASAALIAVVSVVLSLKLDLSARIWNLRVISYIEGATILAFFIMELIHRSTL
jgi:hypothetical protein